MLVFLHFHEMHIEVAKGIILYDKKSAVAWTCFMF